jgi:malonyl-CoA/methylmalonyl-CoA synthetase
MSGNLFTRFRAQHWQDSQPFIRTSDARCISYGDALGRSAQLAHALLKLGVQRGDRIVVQVEKSVTALLLYLASLRMGAIYVPLNTAYTLAELDYFIADADPKLVVCAPANHDAINQLINAATTQVATLAADDQAGSLLAIADEQAQDFVDVACADHELAAILYTSGTTGRSKGAMLSHGNLGSNCFALKAYWQYQAGDVLLHALPIFHTHGLFVATNVTLAAGASMILLPKFDVALIQQYLSAATVLMGVPTFYTRLLHEPWLNKDNTAHLRLFVSGSAPLLTDTHREWRERTGHAILERYGMTETNMNTSNPYAGERVPGTVGLPLPDVRVRVVDLERGTPLGADEIGMIEVQGPNVFCGYWRMPEKTRAEFRDDGFFITGDIGKIDARGYVHIVGRGKDLVISGGFNVYPKEVESEIDALPGVIESAIIGVPHPDYGEGVTAVVVVQRPGELTEMALLNRLRERLASYKLPKRVIFVAELPRNTMGKVQKNVLRDAYAKLYSA